VFLALLIALARRRLKLGDSMRRSLESLLLDERGLGQDVGRERNGANRVVDESFGLGVAGRCAGRFDTLEKTAEHLAFFGGHVALPAGGSPAPGI
jgi:hypothetical protein